MSKSTQVSATDAIRQVIAAGKVMDYVDVVEAVRTQYGLTVSAVQVEKVHGQMRKEEQHQLQTRVQTKVEGMQHAEEQAMAGAQAEHLGQALHFVKSVRGLQNAKRALAELEAIMRGLKD